MLYEVITGLVFELGVDPVAGDVGHDFLETVRAHLVGVHDLHPPAFAFGEAGVHAEKVAREERGFLAVV